MTGDDSDRPPHLLRIRKLAEETFGNENKANRRLRRKLTELHGEAPLAIAQTEEGGREIGTILAKITRGAAA